MNPGLNGAMVLVTRPAAQAEMLCQLIQQGGGEAFRFPTLEIHAIDAPDAALAKAFGCDWLVFTSSNAVDFALKAFDGKMAHLQSVKLAAVGQATANTLQAAGLSVACVPETEFNSEGLLAQPAMQQVEGQRIVIVRGVGGREKLAGTLRERGARVDYLEVYRRDRPKVGNEQLVHALRKDRLRAITITSGEALENLLAMLDKTSADMARKQHLVVVSDRIGQLARDLGFEQVAVSPQPSDAAILETLTTLLNGENSGRSN